MGTEIKRVKIIPEQTTAFIFSFLPSSRYLIIVLDTLIGTPEDVIVIKRPKTESVIWYNPSPSAPIRAINTLCK